jgi:hypothetical protein
MTMRHEERKRARRRAAAYEARQPEPVLMVAPEACDCCGETGGLHSASCAYSDDDLTHGDEGQAALNSRAWLGERGCV